MNSSKQSLYVTLGVIVFSVVVIIMSLHSAYTYSMTKEKIVQEMKYNARLSIVSLQKNISNLIESYAVNEYNNLILTEIERRNSFAIIVEDYNMGKVLGKSPFVSGKMRDSNLNIIDFDPKSSEQKTQLQECYYSDMHEIITPSGSKLGNVKVYITDDTMNSKLNIMLFEHLINTIAISLLLTLSLFIAIRRFMINPLTDIIGAIKDSDDDGIPLSKIPIQGYREVSTLARSMNSMIAAIKASRVALSESEFRWKFAVDGSGIGLWDWNLQNDKLFFSTQWKKMLGFEEHEIAGSLDEWEKRVHPDDIKRVYEDVKHYLSGETEFYINEHRMLCKDDSYKWILARGVVVERSEQGEPIRMLGTHSDITDRIRYQDELDHSAKHDSLTNLPNRFLFNELIQNHMHHCERNKKMLGVFYIDLDGFKEINDTHGHQAGDFVLITVSQRMQDVLRREDIIARLGGDEFVIVISELTKTYEVIPLLERLLNDIEQSIFYNSNDGLAELHVSASIGVTFYPQKDTLEVDALLSQADKAMYDAKAAGKNQFSLFNLDGEDTNPLI